MFNFYFSPPWFHFSNSLPHLCFTTLMGKHIQMHTHGSLLKYNKPQLYDGYLKKKIKKFSSVESKTSEIWPCFYSYLKKAVFEIWSNHELAFLDLTSPNITGNYLVTIWKKIDASSRRSSRFWVESYYKIMSHIVFRECTALKN